MPRNEFNFDNIDNRVPIIPDGSNAPTFDEEFNHGMKLYTDRIRTRKLIKSQIKPLYLDALKRKQEILKRPFYKFQCSFTKGPPFEKYDDCKHIGNFIFDREILTTKEHIDILAKPKRDLKRYIQNMHCNYVKRYFPNCTTRIEFLATPKRLKIEGNFNDYAHLYNARQKLNLSNYLVKSRIKFTSIETALTYIKEEEKMKKRGSGRIKRELRKVERAIAESRAKYVKKIVMAIWEVMKDFLTSPCAGAAADTTALENVIYQQITRNIDSNTNTSSFQKTLKNLSGNLALWTYSFIQTCGFGDIFSQFPTRYMDDSTTAEQEELKRGIIPVEDYIPIDDSSSSSGIIDEECCIEDDITDEEPPELTEEVQEQPQDAEVEEAQNEDIPTEE